MGPHLPAGRELQVLICPVRPPEPAAHAAGFVVYGPQRIRQSCAIATPAQRRSQEHAVGASCHRIGRQELEGHTNYREGADRFFMTPSLSAARCGIGLAAASMRVVPPRVSRQRAVYAPGLLLEALIAAGPSFHHPARQTAPPGKAVLGEARVSQLRDCIGKKCTKRAEIRSPPALEIPSKFSCAARNTPRAQAVSVHRLRRRRPPSPAAAASATALPAVHGVPHRRTG